MLKTILLTFLCLLIASCHQNSSYVSRYGQSIVLNPNQPQSTSDKKLKNLINSKSNSPISLFFNLLNIWKTAPRGLL